MLRSDPPLPNLLLADNGIGAAGARALAAALPFNTHLRCLDMSANEMDDESVTALAEAAAAAATATTAAAGLLSKQQHHKQPHHHKQQQQQGMVLGKERQGWQRQPAVAVTGDVMTGGDVRRGGGGLEQLVLLGNKIPFGLETLMKLQEVS